MYRVDPFGSLIDGLGFMLYDIIIVVVACFLWEVEAGCTIPFFLH